MERFVVKKWSCSFLLAAVLDHGLSLITVSSGVLLMRFSAECFLSVAERMSLNRYVL